MIKENQKYLNWLLILIDSISIVFALLLAWFLRFESGLFQVVEGYMTLREYILPVLFIIPIYIILYNSFKLYIPYRVKHYLEEILNIIKANMLGLLILVLILYIFKTIHYSRYLLMIFCVNSICLMIIERFILRFILKNIRKRGYNLKHILIVGYSELTVQLLNRIEKNKQWGYNVIGIVDDNQKIGYQIKSKKIIGRLSELEKILLTTAINEVMITLELKDYEKLKDVIKVCEKVGVRTHIIPDYYRYIPARPYVEEIDGLPVINIRHVPLENAVNKLIKRIFDIICSLICIIIFGPIMFLIAGLIKITSPGPIVFKQERVGYNRKKFYMYKFRSMHVQKSEEEKVQWTTQNDPRKTKLGNFIRKTSLDELPQLFNVLKGDMSIVGPRPERPFFVEKFKEEIPKYMIKHHVRPGITGWAQVNGLRGDTSIKKRIEHDLYYIENWQLILDIKILWYTIWRGFINDNAY